MISKRRNLQKFLNEIGSETLLDAMFKKIETKVHSYNKNNQKSLIIF